MTTTTSSSSFTDEAIVIDNGSYTLKVGFAGDDAPRAIVRTVVGHGRYNLIRVHGQRYHFIGDEALYKKGVICLHYPVRQGEVCKWEYMEPLWRNTLYNEVRVNPEERPILLTEFPVDTKSSNERMAQILFESLNVPALYVANGAMLSLFATGHITGVVLDMGDGCRVVPIYEGRVLHYAIVHSETLGGCGVSDRMLQMLRQHRSNFPESMHPTTNTDIRGVDYVQDIKERIAYITMDYETDMQNNASQLYELSDFNEILIGTERFRCAEHLFRSRKEGEDSTSLYGVQHLIVESINRCDSRLHSQLYSNIVLSGGSTLFRNFEQRLQMELTKLAPFGTEINIVAVPERKYTSWIGGAMFASTSFIQENWVTRKEYDEIGAACIHRCGLLPPLVKAPLFDQKNQRGTLSELPFHDVDIFTRDA